MDTSRISKIIVEAVSKLSTLDKALDSGNRYTAHWTLLILFGMMQDLQRLAEEEPVPIQIDKAKLFEKIEAADTVMGRLKRFIEEDNFRLASTDAVSLHSILYDIRQLISGEESEGQMGRGDTRVLRD